MDKLKQLPELYNTLVGYIDKYGNYKEKIVDDTLVEFTGDIFKTVKTISKANDMFRLLKFKHFLKGLKGSQTDEKEIERLILYIDDTKKAEYVLDMINKVLNANSKLACVVLGTMMGELVNRKGNVQQEHLQLMCCISVLTDYDIINFTNLYLLVIKNSSDKYIRIDESDILRCCSRINITKGQINLTLNILEQYGLIDRKVEIVSSCEAGKFPVLASDIIEYKFFNELSARLYELTSKVVDIQRANHQ